MASTFLHSPPAQLESLGHWVQAMLAESLGAAAVIFTGETPPLPCVSAAVVAKTALLPRVFRCPRG